MAGVDANGGYVLSLFDAVSNVEIPLPSANGVDIHHLDHATATSRIMFDGLRLSDGRNVVGQIDVTTGAVTMTPTGQSTWTDFWAL